MLGAGMGYRSSIGRIRLETTSAHARGFGGATSARACFEGSIDGASRSAVSGCFDADVAVSGVPST